MCEEEARVVEMRPVEKAAPALSGTVGGSVSFVLGLADVVFGDGGVSSGAVSGCMCDLDRVSGGGHMDVSGVDTVASGAVSGCMCDIDSVSRGDVVVRVGEMSFSGGGDADVCGRDSLVSDGAGDSTGVEVVDDVVACGDDTLLHDAIRVGGWLSDVGDTMMCGAVVARSDRGDTDLVVGSGVTQPGWVDGLISADGSLRPEPPPTNAVWLHR